MLRLQLDLNILVAFSHEIVAKVIKFSIGSEHFGCIFIQNLSKNINVLKLDLGILVGFSHEILVKVLRFLIGSERF